MRIAILGSGNMGGALGRLFADAGHAVTFSYARHPDKLERLATESGPKARAAAPADAVRDATVVLLAVHWSNIPTVLRAAGNLRSKILIDCTMPMNKADTALVVGLRTSGAETTARRARGARVVKAFNTVPAELFQAGPHVLNEQPAVCYCGDDLQSKRVVARLIRDIAFEPVDCGRLSSARYLEPFTLLVAELAYNQGRRPEVGVRFLHPGRKRAKKRR
ncbi:MAG TPA: NADPH-dependent F420 reductase [Gemmatimonadaceae bacterium]|nr:NADPH-dependent F420 reductase [Gemmatimonadaceae bacterium]